MWSKYSTSCSKTWPFKTKLCIIFNVTFWPPFHLFNIQQKYKIAKSINIYTIKRNYNPKSKYKIECRATRTPSKYEECRIRCHGGVIIFCWPITPFVEIRYTGLYPSSKPVWKRQSDKWYETNHLACGPVIICNKVIIVTVEFARWWL
jgi:hypothetical protein